MLLVDELTSALTHREEAAQPLVEQNQETEALLVPDQNEARERKIQKIQQEERINASLLTTIALCLHSLTEGVAMGASLFCKY